MGFPLPHYQVCLPLGSTALTACSAERIGPMTTGRMEGSSANLTRTPWLGYQFPQLLSYRRHKLCIAFRQLKLNSLGPFYLSSTYLLPIFQRPVFHWSQLSQPSKLQQFQCQGCSMEATWRCGIVLVWFVFQTFSWQTTQNQPWFADSTWKRMEQLDKHFVMLSRQLLFRD